LKLFRGTDAKDSNGLVMCALETELENNISEFIKVNPSEKSLTLRLRDESHGRFFKTPKAFSLPG